MEKYEILIYTALKPIIPKQSIKWQNSFYENEIENGSSCNLKGLIKMLGK